MFEGEFSTYVGVAAVLLATGFGLPVPEEVVLVLAGAAVWQGHMEFLLLLAVAGAAIITADFVVFLVGRYVGRDVLRRRFFSAVLPERRLDGFASRYSHHLFRGVFTARFVSGLRAPAYFVAGSLKFPPHRFVLADLIAASIHVPLFVTVGYLSGRHVDTLVKWLKEADRAVAVASILAILLAVGFIGYRIGRRKRPPENGR